MAAVGEPDNAVGGSFWASIFALNEEDKHGD
jgi:hypothetical protein